MKSQIATIWQTYGPYHIARVRALTEVFHAPVICLSHCDQDLETYPFFNLEPQNRIVITKGKSSEIRFFRAVWDTYRSLKGCDLRLILTCGYERPESLGALIFGKLNGIPVFLMLDNQYDDRRRLWIVEMVKRIYLKVFDGFVYGGDTHRDYLRILRIPENREVYGYNCVDNDWIEKSSVFAQASRMRKSPASEYFLCIARLVEKKNLPNLIRAYRMYLDYIKSHEMPWRLVICGDGPLRKDLLQLIAKLGLEAEVLLIGRVDDFDDIVNFHTFAKAFILPSHHNEQWGLVVNEAMAAGKPVLVSRQCGCASSLVEVGVNGFLFDGLDCKELAKHMIWMHENQHCLDQMGAHSRRIIQNFSPQNFARNIRTLYETHFDVGSKPAAHN